MDTLRNFFEDERNRREKEAAVMMPAGDRIAAMIAKQQQSKHRNRWIAWLSGSLGFAIVAAVAGLYFREPLAVACRWAESFAGGVSDRIAEIFENIKLTLFSWGTGISPAAGMGIIEKATSEITGWPVQVWYVVFLAAGVGLLLGADRLVRHRKPV
jgi:hypothetical protein